MTASISLPPPRRLFQFLPLLPLFALLPLLYHHRSRTRLTICPSPFHVSLPHSPAFPHSGTSNASAWPCFVRPPPSYAAPLSPASTALWEVPRSSLGSLNTANPEFKLHIKNQRWATFSSSSVHLHLEGGTAGRAFADNFAYVRAIVSLTSSLTSARCSDASEAPPTLLDMGAGSASVAAAMRDSRGGNRTLRALSYILPDDYLRLQTIASHRMLPAFLANFSADTPTLPFPSKAFDIVHCKWCWHHVSGYDLWLEEVARLLSPGGFFVFTFTPQRTDDLLRHPEWEQALDRQSFDCERHHKIIILCRKRNDSYSRASTANIPACAATVRNALIDPGQNQASIRALSTQALAATNAITAAGVTLPRTISLNCPMASLCARFEALFSTADILHVGDVRNSGVVDSLLASRQLSMLHEWHDNIPVYPRSFDLALIGSTVATAPLLHTRNFWIEIHRILGPGGAVVIMREVCAAMSKPVEEVMSTAMFNIERTGDDDVIVAWRVDV